MKILEFKRSGIGYMAEFRGIPNGYPNQVLCVALIGPYTLKSKDTSQIDFMALTMIDPASSWFEIAELPIVKQLR
jgi:hypothetical protein